MIYLYFSIFISLLPFLFLFTQSQILGGYFFAFGNIAGLIAATLFLWQFALGIRFITKIWTNDLIKVNNFHKLIGKYGVLIIFFHPIIEMFSLGKNISFLFFGTLISEYEKHIAMGRVAFYLFLIIFVSSIVLRKKLKYRPWKNIHYLSYPMMFLVFIHAKEIGTFIQSFSLVYFYWNFLLFIFVILVIFRVFNYLNFFKIKLRLLEKKEITKEINIFVFEFLNKKINILPGQFLYLKYKFFGESHPYTVLKIEKNKIFFGIKKVGKSSKNFSKIKIGDVVFADGAYGVFTKEGQNSENKILIAGGIGITPFYELVKKYSKNTILFYSCKHKNDFVYDEFFEENLKNSYIKLVTNENVKGKNIETKRFSKDVLQKYVLKDVLSKSKFFICGPDEFINNAVQILVDLKISKDKIFIEKFGL